jgi:hypothetical protein
MMASMIRVRSLLTNVAGTPWWTNHFFDHASVGGFEAQAHAAVTAFWELHEEQLDNNVSWEVQGEVPTINIGTGAPEGVALVPATFGAGINAAVALPTATQGLIHFLTDTFVGGRRIRGRTFVPGLCVNVLDQDGSPNAFMNGRLTQMGQVLVDSPAPLCVWSPTHGVAAAVSGVSAGGNWAVLRSRRD